MVRPNRGRRQGIAEQFGQHGGMVVPKGYLKTGFVQSACQPQGNADIAVVVDYAAKQPGGGLSVGMFGWKKRVGWHDKSFAGQILRQDGNLR